MGTICAGMDTAFRPGGAFSPAVVVDCPVVSDFCRAPGQGPPPRGASGRGLYRSVRAARNGGVVGPGTGGEPLGPPAIRSRTGVAAAGPATGRRRLSSLAGETLEKTKPSFAGKHS